jgi:Zn-dependent peptidase ImmA (M78 family)
MRLIGNRNEFAVEIRPVLPWWVTEYPAEQAAWASLAVWVGGRNLCEHNVPGSTDTKDSMFVPLIALAEWFVRAFEALGYEERPARFTALRNPHRCLRAWAFRSPPSPSTWDDWMEERECWWRRHFLLSGADGAFYPNLALVREDEQLVLSWGPARFASPAAPEFRHSEGEHAIDWFSGAQVIRSFVAVVAEQIRIAGLTPRFGWAGHADPLAEATTDFVRRLSMFTSRRIDDLSEMLGTVDATRMKSALGMPADSDDPGESAAAQVLRDLPPSDDTLALGEMIERVASSLRSVRGSRWLEYREIARDAGLDATSPEDAGQRAAHALREALGLDSREVRDERPLVEDLGVAVVEHAGTIADTRMLAAASLDGAAFVDILPTPRTRTQWGKRFEIVRGLGHVLLDPTRGRVVGAASSGGFAQESRRRRAGAFAAEFLLPNEALSEASQGQLDGATDPRVFESVLQRYRVGARTAAMQLWNRGWLSSEAVRDDLIDTFAARDE